MKFTKDELRQARGVNLPHFLSISEKQAACMPSPFRSDAHPSFSIFRGREGKWIGHDVATGETYDAISIVSAIRGLSFKSAVTSILLSQNKSKDAQTAETEKPIAEYGSGTERPERAILRRQDSHEKGQKGQFRYEWREDNADALIYLQDVRGIGEDVITAIHSRVKSVVIKNDKYRVPCVAFENSTGGYNCRAVSCWKFEHVIGRQGLTVFDFSGERGKDDAWVFEANIDALSFATLFSVNSGQLISLNSTSNVKQLLNNDVNLAAKHVFLCLDLDVAGDKATAKAVELMQGNCLSVLDARHFIEAGKDVNDTLMFLQRRELQKKKEEE